SLLALPCNAGFFLPTRERVRGDRHVPVHQLTGTRTACYRVVPPKSTVSGQLREKEEGDEEEGQEEGEQYLVRAALPRLSHAVHHPRAISSLHARRRNEATCCSDIASLLLHRCDAATTLPLHYLATAMLQRHRLFTAIMLLLPFDAAAAS
ncbi:hypothetical protein GW17_00050793, partial [Ensete ventricosum]